MAPKGRLPFACQAASVSLASAIGSFAFSAAVQGIVAASIGSSA